ncbi:MAG: hypothetical protein F4180_02380 [Chloroflexi bacterium]|nr:hypothetical protein [Chloroflexota bacterium]
MVVLSPPGITSPAPAADVAVQSRVGVVRGVDVPSDGGLQPASDQPVVGGEVARSVGLRYESGPGGHHVHELGQHALNVAHEIGVQGELQDGPALRLPRELGVYDFVRPVAKFAGNVHAE